jgi:hypothetical protein
LEQPQQQDEAIEAAAPYENHVLISQLPQEINRTFNGDQQGIITLLQ